MKTIVHVVQHLRPGGIECLVLEIMKYNLDAENGDRVLIVSLEGRKDHVVSQWPRLKAYEDHIYCLNKPSGWCVKTSLELTAIINAIGADAIHTHHIGPLLYGGFAARMAGLQYHIHTEHDAWHLSSRRRQLLEKLLLKLFKPTLVADASFVADQLERAEMNYPAHTIHNGIDAEYFTAGDKILARNRLSIDKWLIQHKHNVKCTKLIGCAGRLVAVKGHCYLLQAMTHLSDDTVLVLAGEGEEFQNILQSAKELQLENRVLLLGAISDMRSFYQAIDIFAMASLNEGLPLSPLEAQACNVPVVLTDVGACNEACCSDTGILVPSQSGTALAWGIRMQIKKLSSGHVKKLSPRSFVETQRSLSSMVRQYQLLIDEGPQSLVSEK